MQSNNKKEYAKLGGCWLSRPIPNSDVFYINWCEAGRDGGPDRTKRQSARTDNEADAEARLAEFVIARSGPKIEGREAQVGPILKWYLDDYACNIASAEASRWAVTRLIEHVGHFTVKQIGNQRAQEKLAADLSGTGIGPASVNKHLTALRAALNRAYKHEILTERPPKIYEIKEEVIQAAEIQPEIFKAEQLRDLVNRARCEEFLFRYILIMLSTGCRPGAARDLAPRQIDLENNIIHLNPPGRKQNAKRRPTVKLIPSLKPFIMEWMKETERASSFVECRGYKNRRALGREVWNRIVKLEMDLTEGYVFYSLRHTVTSMMIAMGVDDGQVSMQLGHVRADVGPMTKKYAHAKLIHVSPNYLKATAEALEQIVSAALIPPADQKVVPFRGRETA